jgi:DNA repair protein RadC
MTDASAAAKALARSSLGDVRANGSLGNERAGPRERAIDVGMDALSDAELIALLLGTGHAGESVLALAAALLDETGGVLGLSRAGLGALTARAGVGLAKGPRGRCVGAPSSRGART